MVTWEAMCQSHNHSVSQCWIYRHGSYQKDVGFAMLILMPIHCFKSWRKAGQLAVFVGVHTVSANAVASAARDHNIPLYALFSKSDTCQSWQENHA